MLIDENGFVMKRFIGAITDDDWNETILPELKKSKNTNNDLNNSAAATNLVESLHSTGFEILTMLILISI